MKIIEQYRECDGWAVIVDVDGVRHRLHAHEEPSHSSSLVRLGAKSRRSIRTHEIEAQLAACVYDGVLIEIGPTGG